MKKFEVERKREISANVDAIQKKLSQLGFIDQGVQVETDVYYSRPDVDYMKTVECLRVRTKDNYAEVTYKPPSDASTALSEGVNAKEEVDVMLSEVGMATEANKLLESVGMVPLVTVEKKRHSYTHPDMPGVSIAVDEITGAGFFIETEVVSNDKDDAQTKLIEIEKNIEVDSFKIVEIPYRDIVMNQQEAK